jgi:hypothetical protein
LRAIKWNLRTYIGTHRNKRQFDFIIFFFSVQACDPLNNMRTLLYNYMLPIIIMYKPAHSKLKSVYERREFCCIDRRADSRGCLLLLLFHSHRCSNVGEETAPRVIDIWLRDRRRLRRELYLCTILRIVHG